MTNKPAGTSSASELRTSVHPNRDGPTAYAIYRARRRALKQYLQLATGCVPRRGVAGPF